MRELNDVPVPCPSCAKPIAVSALGEPNDETTCPHCGATFTYTEEVHESYAGEPGMGKGLVMKLRLLTRPSPATPAGMEWETNDG